MGAVRNLDPIWGDCDSLPLFFISLPPPSKKPWPDLRGLRHRANSPLNTSSHQSQVRNLDPIWGDCDIIKAPQLGQLSHSDSKKPWPDLRGLRLISVFHTFSYCFTTRKKPWPDLRGLRLEIGHIVSLKTNQVRNLDPIWGDCDVSSHRPVHGRNH